MESIPDFMLCPISSVIMTNPVIGSDGRTYEKEAITEWLKLHARSPFTNESMSLSSLTQNRALKEAIEIFLIANPQHAPSSSTTMKPMHLLSSISPSLPLPLVEELNPSMKIASSLSNSTIAITIEAPMEDMSKSEFIRAPVHICAVIDVSGSMDTAATARSDDGGLETFQLSLLDIVKHATRTISKVLNKGDRLSIITYADEGKTKLHPTFMDTDGQDKADKVLTSLATEGSTNIWAGLQTALDVTSKHTMQNELTVIMLLTDGQPTTRPASGEVEALKKYKEKNPDFKFTLATFAFGFNAIDSQLLSKLAFVGDGPYGYIPDASFVGTIFVNCISSILSTYASNVSLVIENTKSEKGLSAIKVNGGNKVTLSTSDTTTVFLGNLPYGQSKSVVLTVGEEIVSKKSPFKFTLKYQPIVRGETRTLSRSITQNFESIEATKRDEPLLVEKELQRSLFVESMTSASTSTATPKKESIIDYITGLKSSPASIICESLLADAEGEVVEALSAPATYKKWGMHYLLSLRSAHSRQECNNFKDVGVQDYGKGELFVAIKDTADNIYNMLPPPKPSRPTYEHRGGGGGGGGTAVASMASLNRAYGGCFSGESLIKVVSNKNGTIESKKVMDIIKGDLLVTPSGKNSTVRCVVKMENLNGKTLMTSFPSGLQLTPYHPIRVGNSWVFPINAKDGKTQEIDCDYVYNFILNEEHIVVINDIECITLGHGIENDATASHPYFGSKIVDDLSSFSSFEKGFVQLLPTPFLREVTSDGSWGKINALDYSRVVVLKT